VSGSSSIAASSSTLKAPGQHGRGPEQQFGVGDDEQRAPRQTRAEVLGHVGAPIQLECAVAHGDAALVRQARQELDREEGVAPRAGEQRGQGVAGARSEPVGDERSQVVGRQRRWDEGRPFPRRHILQASQCGGAGVRSGRREQQDPQGSRPDGERPQPVQALVVGPVDIVGDHRQRSGGRQALGRRHDGTDLIGVGVAVELREQGSVQQRRVTPSRSSSSMPAASRLDLPIPASPVMWTTRPVPAVTASTASARADSSPDRPRRTGATAGESSRRNGGEGEDYEPFCRPSGPAPLAGWGAGMPPRGSPW
jgi:hypothetical protein